MSKSMKRSEFVPKKSTDIAAAQKHLALFGYLNPQDREYEGLDLPPEPDAEDIVGTAQELQLPKKGKLDKPTVEALKSYQSFMGVEETGKLDKKTIECMSHSRCGVPDSNSSVSEFSTHGNKWGRNELTYAFQNYTSDNNLTPTSIHQAIDQAFGLWAAETPLRFRRITNVNSADIRIRFVSGDHGDGASFDGRSGVLAHAFFPPPNAGALAGDAHFDEAENWTINIPLRRGQIDLVTVAAHEFGHSLGLRHSNVNGALMFPSYSGAQRRLSGDDINGIRSIYGGYRIANASWIHGTSMEVEYPERLSLFRRAGFYTYLIGKPDTTNWFHFAIPSSVIMDARRLKIVCAILRFRTFSTNAIVRDVHIWDGFNRIATHNGVNLTGNNWFQKFGVASKPNIYWGINISVGVTFKTGSSNQRRMDFVSAGADLIK